MYILFDIGGTKMRLAGTRDRTGYAEAIINPTPPDFSDALKLFAETARAIAGGEPIEGAAGGAPSPLDHNRNLLLSPTNLPEWIGRALRDELSNALGCRVALENDAALVGLGEAVDGAGKGFSIVAYVTVSTGVGGVRIVDRALDEHATGFEPGRMIIDDGRTLESLVSGTALARRFGKKPAEISDEAVWEELAGHLAVGLNNLIDVWSPDAIVLGGSMIVRDVGIKIGEVKKKLAALGSRIPEMPEIRQATLGDEGGLHGALAYLAANFS